MPILTIEEIRQAPSYELEPLVRNSMKELVIRRVAGDNDIEENWKKSLVSESNYWDRVLSRDLESDWIEFSTRLKGYTAQPFEFADYCAPSGDDVCKVLDVGAGPLTVLGTNHDKLNVEIDAIDPLADHYNDALNRYGLVPPVRTTSAKGEDLARHFAPDSFHLVHSLNALDHVFNPLLCIREMVKVCKPGGAIVLIGNENAALRNVYGGLHQWNFLTVDGDLVIWRPDQKISVQKALGDTAYVRASSPEPERYFVEIHVPDKNSSSEKVIFSEDDAKELPVDYARIYDHVYECNENYTLSHTSPGLRTALMNANDILTAGRRHLDVGAGPGYLVETLSMPPFRKLSQGIEISAAAVKMAEERLGTGKVRLVENAKDWPLEDSGFDLITCFDVLEHLEPADIVKMVEEIRRVGDTGSIALFNISLRDTNSRDFQGQSLHRTVKPVAWWCELVPFDFFAVDTHEKELYGKLFL